MGLKLDGELLIWDGLLANTVYVGLHTASPTEAAPNELSGNAYARVAVASNGWTENATTGEVSNTAAVEFPEPTGDWSAPTHYGWWDAATGGNLLYSNQLTGTPDAPARGQSVSFPAGTMKLNFTHDT